MKSSIDMKKLLPVVGILLVVKFIVVPVVAWQNEQMAQIEQIEKRNDKAQRLLDNEQQYLQSFIAINQAYQQQADAFPHFAKAEDFHIETQIKFDLMLKQHHLEMQRFFWRNETDELVLPGMYVGKFNVDFSGKFKDFALLQTQLATTEQAFKVANFSVNVKKQNSKSMGTVDATFTVEAYYWLGEQ